MYEQLKKLNARPLPWECYTADALWTDPHIARQMLRFHLDENVDAASRNHAFIRRSAAWLTERFSLGEGKSVADFGCGPGLYALPLARTGAAVTGIDFSENSLDYARDKAAAENAHIDYVHANYLDYETEARFDLIMMIMCDFCALSPRQRETMLRKFRRLLKPDGAVVLDVYTPAWFEAHREAASYEHNHMDGFWSAEDNYAFVNVFKYPAEQVVLTKYTIIERDRTRTIYNWLQSFSRTALEREFRENGLEINGWYASVAGDAYDPAGQEMAITAKML